MNDSDWLRSVACRMLGSLSAADDEVRDADRRRLMPDPRRVARR